MKRRDFIQETAVARISVSMIKGTEPKIKNKKQKSSVENLQVGVMSTGLRGQRQGKWIDRKNTFAFRDEY